MFKKYNSYYCFTNINIWVPLHSLPGTTLDYALGAKAFVGHHPVYKPSGALASTTFPFFQSLVHTLTLQL